MKNLLVMTLYHNKYRIESSRLKGYDYNLPGEYFVTIDTKSMVRWFGEVEKGGMIRNEIGEIAHDMWLKIANHHKNVVLDEFIVMPNHIHGILVLSADLCKDVACDVSTRNKNNFMSTISPKSGSLSTIVGSYKSAITKWCHENGYVDFQWHSRFHDHIIRNERELNSIREYIRNNPVNWVREKNSPSELTRWLD
jgi:putative transposase